MVVRIFYVLQGVELEINGGSARGGGGLDLGNGGRTAALDFVFGTRGDLIQLPEQECCIRRGKILCPGRRADPEQKESGSRGQ